MNSRQVALEGLKKSKLLLLAKVGIAGIMLFQMAACSTASIENDQGTYEQQRQEAELDQYQWEQESLNDGYAQDYYEDELVTNCIDANYDQFYNEDELIAYCEENAYEHESDYYYEEEYNYEPDVYEYEDYDGGYYY